MSSSPQGPERRHPEHCQSSHDMETKPYGRGLLLYDTHHHGMASLLEDASAFFGGSYYPTSFAKTVVDTSCSHSRDLRLGVGGGARVQRAALCKAKAWA